MNIITGTMVTLLKMYMKGHQMNLNSSKKCSSVQLKNDNRFGVELRSSQPTLMSDHKINTKI